MHSHFLDGGWNDTYVKNYFTYITDVVSSFGGNTSDPSVLEQLRDIIQFEVNLTQLIIPREFRRNPQMLFNVLTIADMQRRYSYINWLEFVNGLFPTLDLSENEPIAVTDLKFFAKLGKLVRSTPKRTLSNYLLWRLTTMAIPYMSKSYRDIETKYQELFFGEYKRSKRWIECVGVVVSEMPIATGAMYARQFFDETAKLEAIKMVNAIKREFEEVLIHAPWMDDVTRLSALKKLQVMQAFVGYPDELKDDAKLEEYYEKLDFIDGDYYYSILANNKFQLETSELQLREPAIRSDWKMLSNVVDINAYYDAAENKMSKCTFCCLYHSQ